MHFVALVAFCYLFFVFGVFCDKEECSTKNETEKSESECDFKSKLDKLKANVKLPSDETASPFGRTLKNWKNNTDWCGGTFLHMLDPPGPRTALWSIPGSGNYWIRYLIQKTTGYMTGTNLKEYDKPGYPAGHIANGSVIVIKDHLVYIKDYILYVSRNYHKTKFKLWQPPNFDTQVELLRWQKPENLNEAYDRGIVIIRNPLDAFIAEMSRVISGSNVEQGTYDDWAAADIEDLYGNLLLPYWTKFHQKIIDKFKHELYVVEYKALKSNPIEEISKLVNFLGLPMSEKIKKCLSEDINGTYKRSKKVDMKKWAIENGLLNPEHETQSKPLYKKMVKKLKKRVQKWKDSSKK